MTKIGLEREYDIQDPQGNPASVADTLLRDPQNGGIFVPESSHRVIEANVPEATTLAGLEHNVQDAARTLDDIAEKQGLRVVPLSILGNEEVPLRAGGRYDTNRRVRGEDSARTYAATLGLHIHLDKRSDVVRQYNLLLSADPSFAFLSNTPFLLGNNTMNDRRVFDQRYTAFKRFPLHAQLPDYIARVSDIDAENERRHAQWVHDLTPVEAARYQLDNTNWSPIRIRDRTIEVRNADSSATSLVLAQAALYRGLDAYVFDNDLAVRPSASYGVQEDALLVPNRELLGELEREAITHGVRSPLVHRYLSHLVDVATEGLDAAERHYLAPHRQILAEKTNLSDVLAAAAATHTLTPQTTRQLNQYMFLLDKDLGDSLGGVAREGIHYTPA